MDLGSAIVGIIFLLLCVLPFILMSRSRKKREKILMQSLSKIATDNNCNISQYELFANFGIGVDIEKPAVFFYRKTGESVSEHYVDLKEFLSCKVLNVSRSLTSKSGNQKVIDKLELAFTSADKNKPQIRLEFFDANVTPQLFGELQSIQKWAIQLSELLKKK
jgi:hypothetical protein